MLQVILVLKGEIRLHLQLSGRCLKVLKAWYCCHHASTWILHYATYLFVLLIFRFVLLFSSPFFCFFFLFGAFCMHVWPVSSDQCKFSTLLNFKLDDLANCSWSWTFFFVRNGFRLATLPHSPHRQNFLQLLQCCCRSLGSLPDHFSSCLFITVVPYFCLFIFLMTGFTVFHATSNAVDTYLFIYYKPFSWLMPFNDNISLMLGFCSSLQRSKCWENPTRAAELYLGLIRVSFKVKCAC